MALKSTVLIQRLSTSCNVAFTFLFIIIHIIENLSAWGNISPGLNYSIFYLLTTTPVLIQSKAVLYD